MNKSAISNLVRTNIIPLALMIISPPAVQLLWIICAHHGGSVVSLLSTDLATIWSQFPSPNLTSASLAAKFLIFQLLLLVAVPYTRFVANPTPMGNRPEYRINGVLCFFITHIVLASAHYAGWWRYGVVFDQFGPMLAVLNQVALVMTVLLYIRGIAAPTNSDSGRTKHGIIWDLWHGTELHPEIASVSLKQLVNCRFAMMGWSVAIVAFGMKQAEILGRPALSTVTSCALQLMYVLKFFWWEAGYFNTVDIIHDRFGFYIFWGCSSFLPSVYTLTSLYLSSKFVPLSTAQATILMIAGTGAIWANYDTDRQRQAFRAAGGKDLIWGRKPRIVRAEYTTGDGVKRKSLLLASGWWGISRHINYVFELTLALCWSLPAGSSGIAAYIYFIFLTILLTDRAYRDELRCSDKYGQAYDMYCKIVPYRMLPGIY